MDLKRYRVNNIKEALKYIKQDLGPDALIISTRQVKEGKGAFGMFSKNMLEVTAASSKKGEKGNNQNTSTKKALKAYENNSDIKEDFIDETFLKPKRNSTIHFSDYNKDYLQPLQRELQGIRLTLGDLTVQSNAIDNQIIGEMKQDLGEVKNILHILASRTNNINELILPENLMLIYQQMKFGGLEEKFARRIVKEAQKNIDENDIKNFAYVKIFVARMLMKIIKINNNEDQYNSKKILALFGPTGVGKTTTIAKISYEQSIQYKRKVALISVDTSHSSSSEKIRTFAKMINIPFGLVKNNNELKNCIKSYEDFDTIIIDTEGCSQRNDSKIFEIKEIFDDRKSIHKALVLSTTSKDGDMNEATRKFGCISIDSIIFTKLDESATYGSIFNHAIRFKKPLSYLTLGQKVPEDLETASRERLVDLLLNISGT